MGKARDLFKKIRDTKGIFHAKMGTIKDRNSKYLTEAGDIRNAVLIPGLGRSPGGGKDNPLLIFLKRSLVFPILLFSSISLH